MLDQKTKILLTLALIFIGLGILFVFQVQSLGKFRLVACDVGQGDGLLLITPSGKEIIIDGGPGSKIIDCLSQKMPFWDRTIELMVSTHPQRDHMEGLIEILARYKVKMIATTGLKNETEVFAAWKKALEVERVKIYTPKAEDRLVLDGVNISILWPTSEKRDFWRKTPPKELNESSIVVRVDYNQFCVYLTADIPKEILETVVDRACQVLKVSHHGSRTGTSEKVLNEVGPQLAIIQVGKNSFGHPHKEVLDLLASKGIKILRNDTNGIIEVDSDGKSYQLKTEK